MSKQEMGKKEGNLKTELTTRDLKRMFNVSKTAIYNWRRQGLKYFKVGGNGLNDPVRYKLEDVQKFCEEKDKKIVNPVYVP